MIEVKKLGICNLNKIVDAGFDTIPKIIAMSEADFSTIVGFKTMAKTLHDNIHNSLKAASLTTIMAAYDKFGSGMQSKKLDLILNQYPNILTSNENVNEKITKMCDIKGISKNTAELFIVSIPAFLAFLEDCKLTEKLQIKNTMISTEKS